MASLTHARAHMPVVSDGLHLYAVGGYDGNRTASVDMTSVLLDGSLAAWQAVVGMTVGRDERPAVGIANGRLYAAGGLYAGILASTEGAVIHANGTLAAWQGMVPLSVARYQPVGAWVAGSFRVPGGNNDNSVAFFNSTEQAVCDATGAITGWTAGPPMNVARVAHAVAVSGTRIYVSGGVSVSNGPPVASAEFASAVAPPIDFTADGHPDLLWQHTTSGDIYLWYMNGSVVTSGSYLAQGTGLWKVVGVADFNADGKPDLLLQHQTSGDVYLWTMNGTVITGGVSLAKGMGPWKVVAITDLTGDGKPDLLWQHETSGDVYLWTMNGTVQTGGAYVAQGMGPWKVVGPK